MCCGPSFPPGASVGIMRGSSDCGQRTAVAAAAAACVRVSAEVLQGITEPSEEQVETSERMKAIQPIIRKRVQAGGRGERANIPGSCRKLRNKASHHGFGDGPGVWRSAGRDTREEVRHGDQSSTSAGESSGACKPDDEYRNILDDLQPEMIDPHADGMDAITARA